MSQHLHDLLQLTARMAIAEGWDAQKFADQAYAAADTACAPEPENWFPAREINKDGTYLFRGFKKSRVWRGVVLNGLYNDIFSSPARVASGLAHVQDLHVSQLPAHWEACGPKENK